MSSVLDFSSILTIICQPLDANVSSKKCLVRTLDTVFVDRSMNTDWYFTNKTGNISKKKSSGISPSSICDRFTRFALANPNNVDQQLGVFVAQDRSRRTLKDEELQDLVHKNYGTLSQEGCYLQVYLRPLHGEDVVYSNYCKYSEDSNGLTSSVFCHSSDYKQVISMTSAPVDVEKQIAAGTGEIYEFLKTCYNLYIKEGKFEFIVDDNGHAWLSGVWDCSVTTGPPPSSPAAGAGAETAARTPPPATPPPPPIMSPPTVVEQQHQKQNDNSTATAEEKVTVGLTDPYSASQVKPTKKKASSKKGSKSGPDIDMVAKFAAEKEMQMKMMLEQQAEARRKQLSSREAPAEHSQVEDEGYAAVPLDKNSEPNPSVLSKLKEKNKSKLGAKGSAKNGTTTGAKAKLKSINRGGGGTTPGAPTAEETREAEAKRLMELEKLADTTAALKTLMQQQQWQQIGGNAMDEVQRKSTSAGGIGVDLNGTMPLRGVQQPTPQQQREALFRPVPGGRGSVYGPGGRVISATEADFLVRQINNSQDREQQSALFDNLEDQFDDGTSIATLQTGVFTAANGIGGRGEVSPTMKPLVPWVGGSDTSAQQQQLQLQRQHNDSPSGRSHVSEKNKLAEAQQQRIKDLEKQVSTLTDTVANKNRDLNDADLQIRRLSLDVDVMRKQCRADIKKMKDEQSVEILRLKEEHAKQQKDLIAQTSAFVPGVNSPPISVDSSDSKFSPGKKKAPQQKQQQQVLDSPAGSVGTSTIANNVDGMSSSNVNSKLLEQLEHSRAENRKQNELFAEERRRINAECASRILAIERKCKSDLLELRKELVSGEDKNASIVEELNEAKSNILALQAVNRQLESSKAAAVEAQNRLRADLKNMQQSVQASYRLETTQDLGPGGAGGEIGPDPVTAIRLNEAKTEAKTRQMANKLEFMKGQLEGEKRAVEEARSAMEAQRVKLEDFKEEFRSRMLEADQAKRTAVQEAEQRIEEMYEGRMQELTTLQARLLSAQTTLQDVQQDNLMAKQKEEASKIAANRAAAHQTALRTELEQLRAQAAELREEKEQMLLRETSRQNNDSVMRRLDNERQYLKNQLASEITHKNEMQDALKRCHQQLNDVQKQWKEDVDTLKEARAVDNQKAADTEEHLKQTEAQLQAEVLRLTSQNKDYKEGFTKMRDQLRMEQLAIETAHANNRRMNEKMDEALAEALMWKQTDEANAKRHKEAIDAINESIRQQEIIKADEIKRLRDELARQFEQNQQAQMQSVLLTTKFQKDTLVASQLAGWNHTMSLMNKWRLARLQNGFRQWSTKSTLIGVAGQFRSHMDSLLAQHTEEMNIERTKALEALREAMNEEHAAHCAQLAREHAEDKAHALDRADQQRLADLAQAEQDFQERMARANEEFAEVLRKARADAAEELGIAIDRKNDEIRRLEEYHKHELERALADAARQHAYEMKEALEDKEKETIERLLQQKKELDDLHDKAMSNALVDFDFTIHTMKTEHAANMTKLKQLKDAEIAANAEMAAKHLREELAVLNKKRDDERDELVVEMDRQKQEALAQLRADLDEEHEARVRQLRGEWQAEWDENLRKQTEEFEALLERRMEEHSKAVELEKQRAVRLEASKWRQAAKDADQNHELQMARAVAQMSNDKDKEMADALQRAQNRFDDQRRQDMEDHNAAMKNLKAEHDKATANLNAQHAQAMKDLQLHLETTLKEHYDNFWMEKMTLKCSELEAMWKAKLMKEKERLEQFKEDFALQMQLWGAEKAALQRQVENSDERIRQMEKMNKEEIEMLKKGFEEEKDQMNEEYESQKKAEAMRVEIAAAELAKSEAIRYRKIADELVAQAEAAQAAEFNKQMGAMQEESERLISGLEEAVNTLVGEKSGLTEQLQATMNKLEDTEDALYDTQQELKKAVTDQSLTIWKTASKMFTMKLRFNAGIAQFDKDAKERMEQQRRAMQNVTDESTLVTMKLAALLQEVESVRKDTQGVLLSYRGDELKGKKKQIQVLEKELERISMEKDSLDEQKELMAQEVVDMELQVRAIEDQIRVHGTESSMINGRVNVAHARKKRRLDAELERILETIEQKRLNMSALEDRAAEKGRQRDEKEVEMIDLEKYLVQILLEQQRLILNKIESARKVDDQCQMILRIAKLPWPPLEAPTLKDCQEINLKKEEQEEDGRTDDNSVVIRGGGGAGGGRGGEGKGGHGSRAGTAEKTSKPASTKQKK